jgi:imidazole glycerol-phosphate synthase subunit HisH
MKNIAIIDYGLSNLFSVYQACLEIGMSPVVTNEYRKIQTADAVILPGVGAFGDAINQLEQKGIVEGIYNFMSKERPFLGICLGMQLLFQETEEFGNHKGLDIIKGKVMRFPREKGEHSKIKVPQIGWNQIYPRSKKDNWDHTILAGIEPGEYMYFVHSYYVVPEQESITLTETNYFGTKYCSGILSDNISAFQFHPEKSGKRGLEIYKNWANQL